MEIALVLFLLIPTGAAIFARDIGGAVGAAFLPGAFFLFSLFRLAEMSHGSQVGCGLGAAIVVFCTIGTGLSTAGPLLVALIRYALLVLSRRRRGAGGLEFFSETEIGFTPGTR